MQNIFRLTGIVPLGGEGKDKQIFQHMSLVLSSSKRIVVVVGDHLKLVRTSLSPTFVFAARQTASFRTSVFAPGFRPRLESSREELIRPD